MTQEAKVKLALCIERVNAPQAVLDAFATATEPTLVAIDPFFWTTNIELVDRVVCETDENWLQLLPYVCLTTTGGQTFRYTRGGAGEEARLHGNYSVGVGGHIDNDLSDDFDDVTLLDLVRREAQREVKEEVGLTIETDSLTPTHFICDPTNPVGRVHLGLLINVTLPDQTGLDFQNNMEAGTIENAGLFTIPDLFYDATAYARLENWSKVVVQKLADDADEKEDEKDEEEEVSADEDFQQGTEPVATVNTGGGQMPPPTKPPAV